MPKTLSILGSTGSVGCSTLDLVRHHKDQYQVVALTAYQNVDRLVEQALEFRPKLAVIGDEKHYRVLKEALSGSGIDVAAGEKAVLEAVESPSDFVMSSIVGAAGLKPTMAAIKRGAVIGLANKETLVCAGDLVTGAVAAHEATLLPVDSEHNAIFQVFDTAEAGSVRRIILTASGGPFREKSLQDMSTMTPAEAVAHPNWSMGAKISVDSATMMNKGLELIEAWHLFPVKKDQIDILVHPQSVIHSMVEYNDGSILAQLGSPDMRTPIAYALGWPGRIAAPVERLDFAALKQLNFEAPDEGRFPALRLAREALFAGGGAPTILNAANEIAVAGFLNEEIGFLDIVRVVETALNKIQTGKPQSIDDVIMLDQRARKTARDIIQTFS